MKISEYDDETLLEEVKHRGFKIEIIDWYFGQPWQPTKLKIGGVRFDITS